MLLVLKVESDDDMLQARVARELCRSRAGNSDWLARNDDEGVEGLKDSPKSSRRAQLSPKVVLKISKRLTESRRHGLITKQINDMIV